MMPKITEMNKTKDQLFTTLENEKSAVSTTIKEINKTTVSYRLQSMLDHTLPIYPKTLEIQFI